MSEREATNMADDCHSELRQRAIVRDDQLTYFDSGKTMDGRLAACSLATPTVNYRMAGEQSDRRRLLSNGDHCQYLQTALAERVEQPTAVRCSSVTRLAL